ncbi:Organ specific protein [Dillenia turbinata]|uniref:Organ specific protein n=1 Tax=Dillenia turbinata TaxID=194707 RepID=A0AAN8Z432_9MAGN
MEYLEHSNGNKTAELFLVLLVGKTNARKDPGEYWKDIMKNQPMPKAIRDEKHKFQTSAETVNKVKSFRSESGFWIYDEDNGLKEEKSFRKDLKPRQASHIMQGFFLSCTVMKRSLAFDSPGWITNSSAVQIGRPGSLHILDITCLDMICSITSFINPPQLLLSLSLKKGGTY